MTCRNHYNAKKGDHGACPYCSGAKENIRDDRGKMPTFIVAGQKLVHQPSGKYVRINTAINREVALREAKRALEAKIAS
jgi:hypothetical protein